MTLFYIILALFLGSVGSVALAGILLLLNENKLKKISTYLMYLSGGTLLGAAFLGMIPKAVSMTEGKNIFVFILGGILFFFILEKIILWRTCQNENCQRHLKSAIPMILIGDGFHNAIDGIVIAASFLSSFELGVFVSMSVVFHEIPQELADFGILIKGGLNRKKALFYNMLSGSSAILSGIVSYFALDGMKSLIPYALAFSASSFLYISLADLIPEMHKKTHPKESFFQILLILLGISIIFLIKLIQK